MLEAPKEAILESVSEKKLRTLKEKEGLFSRSSGVISGALNTPPCCLQESTSAVFFL